MKVRQFIFQGVLGIIALAAIVYLTLRLLQRAKPDFAEIRAARNQVAMSDDDELWIAIAWQTEDYNRTFLDGIEKAVELVNESGGIIGKTLRYQVYGGESHSAARAIATNPRYLAVIGHETSSMAIPSAITYQSGGVLFLAPFATHPDLTTYEFEFVVRTVPSDIDMVRAICTEISSLGMTNAAVVNVRNHYGISLSRMFEDLAVDYGIGICYKGAYGARDFDFRELAYHMKQTPFDCIVVADALPRAGHVILQLREQQIRKPIFGGDGLDSPLLWDITGNASSNIYVASSYHTPPGDTLEARIEHAATDLDRTLSQAFGDVVPDTYAASGFEAVMLYREAVEQTGIAIPLVVSSTFRFEGPWNGLGGSFYFDPSGNVKGRSNVMKKVVNQRFVKVHMEGDVE